MLAHDFLPSLFSRIAISGESPEELLGMLGLTDEFS
jgi:hypothetical protein